MNTDLDFDHPFSPGREWSLKKCMESKWPWEQGGKMGKAGCQQEKSSGVRHQHREPRTQEGLPSSHAPCSFRLSLGCAHQRCPCIQSLGRWYRGTASLLQKQSPFPEMLCHSHHWYSAPPSTPGDTHGRSSQSANRGLPSVGLGLCSSSP